MKKTTIPLVDVVHLSKLICTTPIKGDLKYTYKENFVGRAIKGYSTDIRDICLLAPRAAEQLCHAHNYLNEKYGLGLLILDAYRPLRAVKDFVKWFDEIPSDYELERKAIHYPDLNKTDLSKLGYIADNVSNHCFGQSVDLTLIEINSQKELNLGPCFDFFGSLSHSTMSEQEIGHEAYQNRKILFTAMSTQGFQVHPKEYWHFDFKIRENQEPLDIEITSDLQTIGTDLITEFSIKGNV